MALYSPFRDSQVATVPPSNAVAVVDGIEACSKFTIAILQADATVEKAHESPILFLQWKMGLVEM